ncbi:hypothetical protein AAVH_11823 [Aphelenchoides avenae]|nr:hypothetical protein AAVH_11823 [Aphelenchus avenae]
MALACRKNPLEILSELRKKALADEPDWMLRLDNSSAKKREKKRPCVVCVARRTSSESSTSGASTNSAAGCASGPAGHCTSVQRSSEPSLVLHLDRSTRRIVKADLRDVNIGICESDFVSKKIDDLCRRSERTVIDALVGSAAKCSAELILCVKSHTITVDAITAPPTDPSEPIRLECVLLSYTVVDNGSGQHSSVLYHNNNYCTSHSAAGIPVSSGSGSLEFEAISPPSLNSRDTAQQAPNPADTLSELCTGLFTGPADTSATFTTLECGSVVQLQPPQSAPPMAQPFRYPNAVAKQMPAPDLKSPGSAKASHHSGETPAASPNASGFSAVLPPLRSQSTSSAEGLSTPSVQISTFPANASSTCTLVPLQTQQNAQLNFIGPPKAEPAPMQTPEAKESYTEGTVITGEGESLEEQEEGRAGSRCVDGFANTAVIK